VPLVLEQRSPRSLGTSSTSASIPAFFAPEGRYEHEACVVGDMRDMRDMACGAASRRCSLHHERECGTCRESGLDSRDNFSIKAAQHGVSGRAVA